MNKDEVLVTRPASTISPMTGEFMTDTHITAPTRFVEVGGSRLAYRRWGNNASSQPPLLLLQHFRGGMDHWDPLMTDGLAEGREVILYNGRGVASSGGTPRTSIEDMADDAAAFVRALGLKQIDALGFSLGGFQALDLSWRHPELVRKLMLLGTGPRGGDPDMEVRVLTRSLSGSLCARHSMTQRSMNATQDEDRYGGPGGAAADSS